MIGSEGTLGILTAATLKLFPQPEGYETAFCSVADPAAALELFTLIRDRVGTRLTAFELMPRFGIDLLLKHRMIPRDPSASLSPWYALIEVNRMKGGAPGALEAALAEAYERALVADATLAQSESERAAMWTARESMSDVQSREGASIKHDVSVPVGAVPALIELGIAGCLGVMAGVRPCPFGHMGDGNIHFNFTQPAGMDPKAFMAREKDFNAVIYEVVLSLGGSVSAEHGIGQLKSELLTEVKDPVAMEMMRSIKRALDPNGILNPGKMLLG
jgi:D-lactate dehydrogenase (cytochrome)